jgi:hypothetical protein
LIEEFPSDEMERIHGIHTKNRDARREINIIEMIKTGTRNDEIGREPKEREEMPLNYEANHEAKTGQSFTNHQFCGSTANTNLQSSNGTLEA